MVSLPEPESLELELGVGVVGSSESPQAANENVKPAANANNTFLNIVIFTS